MGKPDRRSFAVTVGLLLVLGAGASAAAAQSGLEGNIQFERQAVPQAPVRLLSMQGQFTTQTDASGNFSFPHAVRGLFALSFAFTVSGAGEVIGDLQNDALMPPFAVVISASMNIPALPQMSTVRPDGAFSVPLVTSGDSLVLILGLYLF